MSDAERRAYQVFKECLDLPDDARDAYIDAACAGQPESREIAHRLLRIHRANADDDLDDDSAAATSAFSRAFGELEGADEPPEALPDLSGAIVGDQFRLDTVIGRGAVGVVYRAVEEGTRRTVAVKVVHGGLASRSEWFAREIRALLLLDVPGVVRLLDYGDFRGRPYLVTELVDGQRFPGERPPVDWARLEAPVCSLLEILARVHRLGIAHGDLKPGNVLVTADGGVMVLDLGIAGGPAMSATDSEDAIWPGTPPYMAPEQLHAGAGPPTERTDLYSVGAMIHKALTGQVPHASASQTEMARRRRSESVDVTDLEVPEHVRAVIAALLARAPDDRPDGAAAALAALRREQSPFDELSGLDYPWIVTSVERVLAAASDGQALDLHGPPGSGKRRVLRRAAADLSAMGVRVYRVCAGSTPGSSLVAALTGRLARDRGGATRSTESLAPHLRLALESGDVVLVDDWDHVDPLSRDVLDDVRSSGCVVRAGAWLGPDAVAVGPGTEAQLRELFAGPDRLVHLREDGASLLMDRSGGVAARVGGELREWMRARFARIVDGRVVVDRDALERIDRTPCAVGRAASPCRIGDFDERSRDVLRTVVAADRFVEIDVVARVSGISVEEATATIASLVECGAAAVRERDGAVAVTGAAPAPSWSPDERRARHRALAMALPPGSPGRTRQLLAGGLLDQVPDDAAARGQSLLAEGRVTRGLARTRSVLGMLRRMGAVGDASLPIARVLVVLAMVGGSRDGLRAALHELDWIESDASELRDLKFIAHAALLAMTGLQRRALAVADAQGPVEDIDLELRRNTARRRAAARLPEDLARPVLDDLQEWAATRTERRVQLEALDWLGWQRYGEGRFREAAELFGQIAERSATECGRGNALAGAASALLEAHDFDAAVRAAEQAVAIGRDARFVGLEARAERSRRSALYRSAQTTSPDRELVEALQHVRIPNVTGMALLTEAALAWRSDDRSLARDVAQAAAVSFADNGQRAGEILALALQAAVDGDVAQSEITDAINEIVTCPLPGIVVQAIGLFALRSPAAAQSRRTEFLAAVSTIPEPHRAARREVISVAEAVEFVALRG